MAEPFLGEIRITAFDFAPYLWASRDGSVLVTAQNSALYSLIGAQFGGSNTQFRLPNLASRFMAGSDDRDRPAKHMQGDTYGHDAVTLNLAHLPPHTHNLRIYSGGTRSSMPTWSSALSISDDAAIYAPGAADVILNATDTGNCYSGAHENRQPLLAMNSIICLFGDYPQFP